MGEQGTRGRVEQELRRTGYPQQHIDEMLRDIASPADHEVLARQLQKVGVTRSALISDIGGSP